MFRTKPGEGRALIEDWVNRPSLRKLVEAFDGAWPDGDVEHIVAELVQFSEIWDYRGGTQSRLMFHEDPDAPDPFEDLTYEAADELGLLNPELPSDDTYDYLLILGGLATGVEPRVQYAARLVDEGLTVRRQIAGLGSYRELQERELPISHRYAPAGRYEIDHLAAMMNTLFRAGDEPVELQIDDTPTTATVWETPATGACGPSLVAYSAVSADPDRMAANTAETYQLFLAHAPIESGQTALLVTSAIYVPYQHLDGVRVLGAAGLEVETVGLVSPSARRHPPSAHRQEIRSMLQATQRYLQAAQETASGPPG